MSLPCFLYLCVCIPFFWGYFAAYRRIIRMHLYFFFFFWKNAETEKDGHRKTETEKEYGTIKIRKKNKNNTPIGYYWDRKENSHKHLKKLKNRWRGHFEISSPNQIPWKMHIKPVS